MWSSLLSALVAFLLLSDIAIARPRRRDVLQIGGVGFPINEATDEPVVTITVHKTVTMMWDDESTSGTDSAASTTLSYFPLIMPTTSSIDTSLLSSSITPYLMTVLSTSRTPISSTTSSFASLSTFSITSSSMPSSTSSTTLGEVSSSTAPAPAPSTSILRGVNLGGWLVLEKWMDGDAFTGQFTNAVDQWTFDSISGAKDALKTHWDSYFTEADLKTIAATGINALRIPIGYWAYDNAGTPYIQGADAYLEKAIGWARDAGMKVWVDCHGSPGSQNGFDNSGRQGNVEWQQPNNLARSIDVLKTMATKYGSMEYADVVVGLELVNEPISYGNNVFSTSQSWAQTAFKAVKAVATNPNLVIVMHDAFQGAPAWTNVVAGMNANRQFGLDSHMYQLFTDADNSLTQAQHITKACGWVDELAAGNKVMPTYVGEFSAATNICVNPDGSTTAGTSCSVSGCQCQSADFGTWNDKLIEQTRRFVEAQLDAFEESTSGYFIWSAKGPGGWGFLNGIQNGIIPSPITSRKYPGQCSGSKRRARK